jgi:peptidoglycan/LPS O-acetylase OafA/YrhL
MDYRREIDGLRALAVLPVIFFHAGFQTFSGGFVGVDIFFVISGYLITSIILAEMEAGTFTLANFYERRARRILPALFVVVAACLPLAWLLLPPLDMKGFLQSLVAIPVFASNILFWQTSGYFDTSNELKPLLHTWSLAVEEQYYLFFPIFLMLTWRLGKRWVLGLLIVIAIASLVLAQWASIAKPSANFYLLPTRGWELLVGAFLAFYFSSQFKRQPPQPIAEFGGFAGLSLIVYSVFAFDSSTPFPSFYTLVPTVGAALIILLTSSSTLVGRLIGSRLLVGVGLISYSAYLWHQPLLAFARTYTLNQINDYQKLWLFTIIILLSCITYKVIETPFRERTRYKRKLILLFSLTGSISFVAFGAYGVFSNGFDSRFSDEIKKYSLAASDWAHPGRLVKTSTKDFYVFNEEKPISLLFFGDSHAEQFAPLAEQFSAKGKNVGFLTGGGCPPIPNIHSNTHFHCNDLFKRFEKIIDKEKSIDAIVIAGCFNCYFPASTSSSKDSYDGFFYLDSGKKYATNTQEGRKLSLERLADFLNKLPVKIKVIVIGDNPVSEYFNHQVIIQHSLRGESSFFKSKYPAFQSKEILLPSWQVSLNNELYEEVGAIAKFVNLISIMCPDKRCEALDKNGNPIYKDSNHIRPFYVKEHLFNPIFDALVY